MIEGISDVIFTLYKNEVIIKYTYFLSTYIYKGFGDIIGYFLNKIMCKKQNNVNYFKPKFTKLEILTLLDI